MPNPRLPEFDQNSPLRPACFGPIVLKTGRFQEMAHWYKTVLHAKPLFEIRAGTFLTFDDEHHRLLIIEDPNVTPREATAEGVAHWAYLYNSLTGLMRTYARLRDAGITPPSCVNHGFQFSLYDHDPDNDEVELGCDNFGSREELNEWFTNGQVAKNFYGYNFDPEFAQMLHVGGASDRTVFDETYKGEAPDLSAVLGAEA